jgi:nitrite reductase/ring-hydroxylating ferredoxin subunit
VDSEVDRRRVLRGLCAAALALPPAVHALLVALHPLARGARRAWRDAGALDALEEGVLKPFTHEIAAGWETRKELGFLLRRGGGVVAFRARCTHLGCRVRPAEGGFHCPCHDGRFDLDGRPAGGPVTRPLERIEARVRDGRVEVSG